VPQEEETMPRYKTMNYDEPLLAAVDYVVDGPRTAAAVAAGRSRLTGMRFQTAGNVPQDVAADNITGVLHGLDGRPRLYNDALFGLAVEAQNDLPSLSDVADIDDLRTMLCLLYRQAPSTNGELAIDRGERVRIGLARVNNPLALCARLSQQILAAGMFDLYRNIELPVLAPVLAMTLVGLPVNRPVLLGIKESHETQMEIARRILQADAGSYFNPDDAVAVRRLLYNDLGLPCPLETRHGNQAVSKAALAQLLPLHPLVAHLQTYRDAKSAYDSAAGVLAAVDPATSIVRGNLDSLGTATGRFSCSDPPLQALDRRVRRAIEAAPGCVLMEADYSQMELRVLAHFSQDPALLHAFQHDIDLHVRTTSQVLGIAEADVDDQQRQLGKTLNFGIVYGQTAYGLADELAVPLAQAEALLAAHTAAYPGVTAWIAAVHQQAANTGEVRTLYGRRRYLPNIYSASPADAAEARRYAVNTIIQGTAADLMKMALIRLHNDLPDGVQMLLPVHDSVLLSVPTSLVEETRRIVTATMETLPDGFSVPLKVEVKSGKTWADCK